MKINIKSWVYFLVVISIINFITSCSSTDKKNSSTKKISLKKIEDSKRKLELPSQKEALVQAAIENEKSKSKEEISIEQFKKDLEDEKVVGREMASKLYGTYGEVASKDRVKYLNLILQTIVKKVGRPELEYKVGILDGEDANAFATPGGYILVTDALLKSLQNEEELAGVLAHEVAHINFKHLYKDMNKDKKKEVSVSETISRVLLMGRSDFSQALLKAVEEGMNTLTEKGLKPELEYEADENAINYIWAVGYSPEKYINVLERLNKKTNHETVFSKTHPTFESRVEKLNNYIATAQIASLSNSTDLDKRTQRFVLLNK